MRGSGAQSGRQRLLAAVVCLACGAAGAATALGPVGAAPAVVLSGGDTAWMLVSTVLVMLMTLPGLVLFYGGMLRTKNALSIAAHTLGGTAVVTLVWAVLGYSLAFTPGNAFLGGSTRVFGAGLLGPGSGAHPAAPTVPEPAFFMFELSFAIVAFALILGATAERMRLRATLLFAAAWTLLVYVPVAHWVWHPGGWLAAMGHMDFAGGTVVHIASGSSALVAAWVLGPRLGFGREPMLPHNLMLTVLGGGLLWTGWFGSNAGSAFEASSRAAGAVLTTQVAACAGAAAWGGCETLRRGQSSVLGLLSGAIAGLIAITPASGYVAMPGALAIGGLAGAACFACVLRFKALTGVDDALDVFALHGVGGIVGTVLTPLCASDALAPASASVLTNALGAVTVMAYAGLVTWLILHVVALVTPLRVAAEQERQGLDIAEHGEMLTPGV
jgi:Amt family ammonium transporter